ncbi:MAG: pyruvate, phosphate dikinase, partial [Bacilli bacterium]|nr:pyruvate, phosphate dikinase [Bacilli bacterium]
GIGLCRTEHMFFDKDRIFSMRKMILADTVEERRAALAELEPMQQSDFEALYETMEGLNVNVRLLDPPLHEFLPQEEDKIEELAKATGRTVEEVKARIEYLHEFNPMMGHRGCRLAVSYPEICEMQTEAIIKAAINVTKKGIKVEPEIMVPLVLEVKELKFVKKIICDTADKIIKEAGVNLKYHVGTMIEIPRAALLSDEIAQEAEFFSFGTNDLTQMTFGFSRDDAAKFLPDYYGAKILEEDPFKTLDQRGVGKLIDMSVKAGRSTRKDLHIGVCGETGGEPNSIDFYHRVGLDYVSCSPFRVPVARLAAAQAAIRNKK